MAALSPVGMRVRTNLDWPDFLSAVDAVPPAKEVLAAAVAFLHAKCGFGTPEAAAGLEQTHMTSHADYPASLVVRAFLATVLKAIKAVHEASLRPPPQPALGSASPPQQTQALAVPVVDEALRASLQNALGSNCSAATLA